MVFKSGRGKGSIICASILIGALLSLGASLATASIWGLFAGFFPQNYLYTLLNALTTADRMAAYDEAPKGKLRGWINSPSQVCAGASSNLKLFEGRSVNALYARITGTVIEKSQPNGTDMVLRE